MSEQTSTDAERQLERLLTDTIAELRRPVEEMLRGMDGASEDKRRFALDLLIAANDRVSLWLRGQR